MRVCRVQAKRGRHVAEMEDRKVGARAGRAEILELFSGRDWPGLFMGFGVRYARENADEGRGVEDKRGRNF
jgi:hypothetical protein